MYFIQLFEIYKMNLITNYYGLNLIDWEKFAHSACFAVEQQIKSQAERLFYELTQTPDMNIIMSLISNGSDTLVFVLFSYFLKNPSVLGRDLQKVLDLIQCITGWQFRELTFVRNNLAPLQKYVTRTIITALGVFLKILYESESTSKDLMDFLVRLESNYFKLYLLKSFVDAVEIIDYDMGYMKYRTMVYSFQDQVIPMMCETLMPYFYKIEEGVQINELSFLHQKLNVSDVQTDTSNSQPVSITSEQQLQSDYVFMLLQKIVQFNYNITYSEYDSDQPIDTCLITFPDKISAKIINQQFLDALFFIVEKVSDAKIGYKKHEYLEISLGCIAKMMQSRMTYLDQAVKENYLYHALMGLNHLLLKCQQIGSQILLEGILTCNKKIYMNCELSYLKSISLKYSQNQSAQLYFTYLNNLSNMITMVVQNSFIHVENHLLLEAVELVHKLVVSHGYRDQENIDDEDTFFQNFIEVVIRAFINNLAHPKSIFQSFKIISITENKPLINQLFEFIKKIGSANYQFLFQIIWEKVNNFVVTDEGSLVIFANLLYLLTQVIDHSYLERSIFLKQARDSEYCIIGRIIAKATQLASQYVNSRNNLQNQATFYVDTAVILFTQALAVEFLNGFEYTNHFKIKQKLYLFMAYGDFYSYSEFSRIDDEKSQEALLGYMNILTEYLHYPNSTDQYEVIVHYVLNAIEKCIFKLKWHMKRQFYLKTLIFKFLYGFFESFFYNRNHVGDIRSRVAKIVVTLTFDDVLDEYKFRINKFLSILKKQSIELMQYDLIGIFQGIETHAISKYFYNRLKKEIDLNYLITNIFEDARNKNDPKSYKDFCKLIRSFLNNKGFRISNSLIIYESFKLLLPYLIQLLKEINRNDAIDMDLWDSSICEIMDIFKGAVGGTHINIYLLDNYTKRNGQISLIKQFVIQVMKTTILLSSDLQVYPQMEQNFLSICTEVNKELLDYIFSDQTSHINEIYAILHVKLIDITISYIKMMINGNKIQEDKMVKVLDCLRYFFSYFNRKCKIIHKKVHLNNLKQIYQFSQNFARNQAAENKNEQLIEYIINFIMTNHKNNISFVKTITRMIYELNQLFSGHIFKILNKLQLKEEKYTQIESILNQQARESEQNFMERMKSWIKQVDVFI